ncbi:MAG: hypothetical protein WC548_00650 [Candidatus Pacearchaeota archaeon]
MVIKKITYYSNGKKFSINAKICKSLWSKFSGLMFRKKNPPLFFVFNKNKKLSIHSFFCKPFRAIWLDDKMNVTKIIDIKTWEFNFSGKGRYLLEIPLGKSENYVENRNI